MKKTGVILAGAAVFVVCRLFAETQIPLWPDGAMPVGTNKGVVVGKETVSEKGIVQNVSVPAIEVFLPTNTTRSAMGVVICPGGAYGCLDFEHEGRCTARFLSSIGVAAFVLQYRVRPYPKDACRHSPGTRLPAGTSRPASCPFRPSPLPARFPRYRWR